MDLKEKLLWFTVKELRTEQYIYEKQIKAFDYAIFLNDLTGLYIKARDHKKVNELLTIQRAILE